MGLKLLQQQEVGLAFGATRDAPDHIAVVLLAGGSIILLITDGCRQTYYARKCTLSPVEPSSSVVRTRETRWMSELTSSAAHPSPEAMSFTLARAAINSASPFTCQAWITSLDIS